MGLEALMEARPLWKGGAVGCALGMILYIVGFSTTYWISVDAQGTSSHQGLWRACFDFQGSSICGDIADAAGWYRASQALSCIGLAWWLIGDALGISGILQKRARLARIGAYFVIKAGVFGIATGALMLAKFSDEAPGAFSVGWSSIIFLVGSCFGVVAGVLQMVGVVGDFAQTGMPVYKM